ncbi:homeobox protein Mohawk isoform X1 [Terrapene carolina triunguis]|uniref:homeobox protein Mohawk isoform X1 n=2 Tax=Terrapene triunguis TaxID=2587831 RepID=UPI000CEFE01A|nr:homeobox protein Mohawk isoform X1 [Terrapene carolina triunguis]
MFRGLAVPATCTIRVIWTSKLQVSHLPESAATEEPGRLQPTTSPPTMNTVVFNKFNSQVLFEENAKERESNSRPYLGVIDSPHHPEVHIPDSPSIKDNLSLRNRRTGARQSGGKVRHKRQALQDMARPLKQWLYKHRDNPYPTKTEKILLALGSQMTLVQVSNWFANARRRLKNTVRQPDLSWALRIKLYNKYVQGNAERLSVSSDDSCSEDGENPPRNHINEGGYNKPVHHTVIKTENSVIKTGVRPETSANEDYVSPPKYKSSLLNRYLNDSLRHVMATNAAMMEKTRQRNHSGSFSSNEFEEELVSPSSSETEGNFVYRTETLENGPNKCESAANRKGTSKDETYWKEINAAMALTNLAQGKDKLQGTTSCIIQKSSHISEIKTVKVPLVQQF